MELDKTGWPQLPQPGTMVTFEGGAIDLQVCGVCEIVTAWHTSNVTGKPGGKVELRTDNGEVFTVPLSQFRNYAVELSGQEAEAARQNRSEHLDPVKIARIHQPDDE